MKKASLVIVILTLICCTFAGGFFLGRGTTSSPISVSVIPTATMSAGPTTESSAAPTDGFPIDINTATAEDFSMLPGIGETLANRIVSYREDNGPFQTLADLLNVEGIGEKKLESILDYITIGGQP